MQRYSPRGEANKAAGVSPRRVTPREHVEKQAEDYADYQKRRTVLIENGISEQELKDYDRTEVIRRSVTIVQQHALAQKEMRKSPSKYYSKVSSKVAGNLKSQKTAKKNQMRASLNQAREQEAIAYAKSNAANKAAYSPDPKPVARSPTKKYQERNSQILQLESELRQAQEDMANKSHQFKQTQSPDHKRYEPNFNKSEVASKQAPQLNDF